MRFFSMPGRAVIAVVALSAIISACGQQKTAEPPAPGEQVAQSEVFPEQLSLPTASYAGVMRMYGEAGAPIDAKVFASAAKIRMEMPGGAAPGATMAVVTDLATRQSVMFPVGDVPAAARIAMTMSLGEAGAPDLADLYNSGVTLRRIGLDMVAGQRCALWEATDPKSQEATVSCVTSDGVNMRTVNAKTNAPYMEMAQVSRGPQDPALFAPPPGYKIMALPNVGTMPNPDQMRQLEDLAKGMK